METTVNIAGVNYPASPALAAAVATVMTQARADADSLDNLKKQHKEAMDAAAKLQKRIDELETSNNDAKAAADKATARADGAEAALEKAKGERMDASQVDALVAERVALIGKVAAIVPATVKLDGLSVREMQAEAVKAVFPKVNLDGQSDAYVETLFDAAVAEAPGKPNPAKQMADATNRARHDAADGDTDKVEVAKNKQRQDSQDGWKQPIGITK